MSRPDHRDNVMQAENKELRRTPHTKRPMRSPLYDVMVSQHQEEKNPSHTIPLL